MAMQNVRPDPGAMERQDRRQRRRQTYGKVGVYALITAVVIVVAVAAFALWSTSRVPEAVTRVRPSATGQTATKPTESSNAETALPTLGNEVDYLLDLKTGETTPLPERIRGHGQNGYAISPDGSEVAYSQEDTSVSLGATGRISGRSPRTWRPSSPRGLRTARGSRTWAASPATPRATSSSSI